MATGHIDIRWSSGLSEAAPEVKQWNSVGCHWETKLILIRFFSLKLPSTFAIVTVILWREGEIVFFEGCDLKGCGREISHSFMILFS